MSSGDEPTFDDARVKFGQQVFNYKLNFRVVEPELQLFVAKNNKHELKRSGHLGHRWTKSLLTMRFRMYKNVL